MNGHITIDEVDYVLFNVGYADRLYKLKLDLMSDLMEDIEYYSLMMIGEIDNNIKDCIAILDEFEEINDSKEHPDTNSILEYLNKHKIYTNGVMVCGNADTPKINCFYALNHVIPIIQTYEHCACLGVIPYKMSIHTINHKTLVIFEFDTESG